MRIVNFPIIKFVRLKEELMTFCVFKNLFDLNSLIKKSLITSKNIVKKVNLGIKLEN